MSYTIFKLNLDIKIYDGTLRNKQHCKVFFFNNTILLWDSQLY